MTTAPTAPTARPHTPAAAPARAPHAAGTGPNTPTAERTFLGLPPAELLIRIVLAVVMSAALAVGTWSIFTLLMHQFHAPKPIAVLGCGMFDVAALFFALLSQRYAVTTDSGLAPRAAMLAMISVSSWVNWRHGQMEGWGTVGSVILSAAPIIAELSFEMFHRFAHRESLRRLGRVAQALPVLGKWAWLAHPLRSGRAVDAHIRAALTEHEALAQRREELAVERARVLVSVSALNTPALTETLTTALSGESAQALTLTPEPAQALIPAPAPARERERPTLTAPAERPALTGERAQHDGSAHTAPAVQALTGERAQHDGSAHTAPAVQALTAPERPASAPAERAQPSNASTERAHHDAQSAPSLTDRKALKDQQDALTLSLYRALNRRPEWTEIRDALVSAGLESVSRPTAQRIRERVQSANPELPRERTALTGTN